MTRLFFAKRQDYRYPANIDSSHDCEKTDIGIQMLLKRVTIEKCTKLNDKTANRDRQRHAGIQCV